MRHRTLNCAQADRNVMPSQWHSAHKIAVASVLAELPGKALGMLGQAASPRWRLIELPAIHAQVSSHGVAAAAQLVGDPIGVPAKRCRLRVASTPSSACIACLQSTRLDRGTWSNTLPSLLACGHEEVLYTTVLSSRRHGYHDNCSYHNSHHIQPIRKLLPVKARQAVGGRPCNSAHRDLDGPAGIWRRLRHCGRSDTRTHVPAMRRARREMAVGIMSFFSVRFVHTTPEDRNVAMCCSL
jgi:hypothetical protein